MTIFTVLEPPDGKPDRVAFVPEGFAWGGFVFTVLWALWHRMWVVAALLFARLRGAERRRAASRCSVPASARLLQFGIALLFGFEARQLQVTSLERAGFRRAGLIQASGLEAAELAYFAGQGAGVARSRTRPLSRRPGGYAGHLRQCLRPSDERCHHRLRLGQSAFRRQGLRARGA